MRYIFHNINGDGYMLCISSHGYYFVQKEEEGNNSVEATPDFVLGKPIHKNKELGGGDVDEIGIRYSYEHDDIFIGDKEINSVSLEDIKSLVLEWWVKNREEFLKLLRDHDQHENREDYERL